MFRKTLFAVVLAAFSLATLAQKQRIEKAADLPRFTYKVDGRQYMLVATGDTLYAFMLY